jgi:hypothetical protein
MHEPASTSPKDLAVSMFGTIFLVRLIYFKDELPFKPMMTLFQLYGPN